MQWSYLDSAVIAMVSFYLMQAPYTKVEESFSIQAIHDILKYSIFDISQYDHFQYPGVVPRSFVGPLIIAYLTKPFVAISTWLNGPNDIPPTEFEAQLLVRCVIGLTNCISLIYLKNAAQQLFTNENKKLMEEEKKRKQESRSVRTRTLNVDVTTLGTWFLSFIISGFHLMYYSSRPLPNFVVALPLTNIVISWVLVGDYSYAISLCALTSVVFRSEIAALGIGITLFSIVLRKISIIEAIKYGIMGVVAGLALSLTIDSYFWRTWCVPEVTSFFFNVVDGNSSNWGTEHFFAYFTHYLRMLYLPPTILLLSCLGYSLAPTNLKIVILASLFHILTLSIQPHKEWRFIVYTLPVITLSGSVAAAYLWENISVDSVLKMMLISLLPLTPILSMVCSLAFLFVSRLNYPGGEALSQFNHFIMNNNITNATVHLSVAACMTGITRFSELNYDTYGINYDKTETLTELEAAWSSYDYLITTENSVSLLPFDKLPAEQWELIGVNSMFGGINTEYISDLLIEDDTYVYELAKHMFNAKSAISVISTFLKNLVREDNFIYTYKRISLSASEKINSEDA